MAPGTFTLTAAFENPDQSLPAGTVVLTPVGRSTPSSTVVPAKGYTAYLFNSGSAVTLSSSQTSAVSPVLVAGVAYYVQELITGVTPVPAPYILPAQSASATVDLSTVNVSSSLTIVNAYQGNWSSTGSYQPGQVVTYKGAPYVAILPSTDVLPTNATYWGSLTGPPGTYVPSALFRVLAPTGVVATDSANVTAAVAALNAAGGGGTLSFQDGTYVINSNTAVVIGCASFAVTGTGATIIQQASNTVALPNNTAGDLFVIADSVDFRVEGIIFDANRDVISPIGLMTASASETGGPGGTGQVTITAGHGANYQVGQRLYVNGGVGTADAAKTDVNGGTGMVISTIAAGAGSGGGDLITFTTALTNTYTHVSGALINDQYGPYAATGGYIQPYQTGSATVAGRALAGEDQQNCLHLLNCQRFVVNDNEARNMWESGIKCGSELGNGDTCSEGSITSNNVYHGYDQGISVWFGTRISVTKNTVNSAGWAGICLTSSAQCLVEGNISSFNIYDVPGDQVEGHGIAVEGGSWNTIKGNIVWQPNNEGIHMATPPFFTAGSASTITGYLAAGTAAGTHVTVASSTPFTVGYPYSIVDGPRTEQVVIATKGSGYVTFTQPTRFSHGVSAGTTPLGSAIPEDTLIEGNLIYATQNGAGINNQVCVRARIIANHVIDCAQLGGATFNWGIVGVYSNTGLPSGAYVGGDGSVIEGNVVSGCYAGSLIVDSVTNYTITGNKFYGPVGGSGNKVVVFNGLVNSIFSNNEISSNEQQGGLFVQNGNLSSTVPSKLTIQGNIVSRVAAEGMIFLSGTQLDIADNIVTSCGGNGGIDLRGITNSQVRGNICNGNSNGIYLESSCSGIIVSGNTCIEDGSGINVTTGAAQTQSNGIYEKSGCSADVFFGNICSGNTSAQQSLNGTTPTAFANILSGTVTAGSL